MADGEVEIVEDEQIINDTDEITEEIEENIEESKRGSTREKRVQKVQRNTSVKSNKKDAAKHVTESPGKNSSPATKKPTQSKTTHNSSFPNVLKEYGLEDRNRPGPKKQNDLKSKKTFTGNSRPSSGFESCAEREREKNEKYMQLFEDYERAKKYYYSRYMKSLQGRLENQRDKIQKKTDELYKKIQEKEERERAESHIVKKRLQRVDVNTDDSFLRNLPKSAFYKIVKLEQSMKAQGKLKNQMDVDEFWTEINKPEVYQHYFGAPSAGGTIADYTSGSEYSVYSVDRYSHHTDSDTQSVKSASKEIAEKIHPGDYRPIMSRIQESKESSRPVTRNVPAKNVKEKPDKVEPASLKMENMSLTEMGKQAAIELDRRCPRVEMPELACFTMELGEKPLEPEEEQRRAMLQAKERARRIWVKKYQKMYKLAMTHNASAQRIMEKHHTNDLDPFLGGPSIRDITGDHCFSSDLIQKDQVKPSSCQKSYILDSQLVPVRKIKQKSHTSTSLKPRSASSNRTSSSQSQRSQNSVSSHNNVSPRVDPQTLTLENLKEHGKVMESKAISTFWNNYLHVGKSMFAPS